jgi:hypothetical protein
MLRPTWWVADAKHPVPISIFLDSIAPREQIPLPLRSGQPELSSDDNFFLSRRKQGFEPLGSANDFKQMESSARIRRPRSPIFLQIKCPYMEVRLQFGSALVTPTRASLISLLNSG